MLEDSAIITNYPAAGKEIEVAGIPHVLVPDNCRLQSLEERLHAPQRIRASVTLYELASFLVYVNDFKGSSQQERIFAQASTAGLTATCIFDYPLSQSAPAWGQHRSSFIAQHTPEWNKWRGQDKQAMTQTKFAEFVEDNIKLFTKPVGVDMLTIAREIELKQNVEFKGTIRLENGDTSINYVSNTKAGAGTLEVPPAFKVALQPFVGGPRYELDARLRVKLEESTLTLRYELLQVDALLEFAAKEIVENIDKGCGIKPLNGPAPSIS